MRCAEPGCLASIGWLGLPDDEAITQLATVRGWRVFEGKGWICPHHKKQAPTKSGGSDAE